MQFCGKLSQEFIAEGHLLSLSSRGREREKGNAQVSLPLLKKTLMPSWESAITTSSGDCLPKARHPRAITVEVRASSLGRQTFIRFRVFHMSLHP